MLRAATKLEDQDYDGSRWPRSKRHDDKTAVLIAAGQSDALRADEFGR